MANLTRKQRFGRNYGEAVRQERTARGWSLSKMTEASGVDMANLSKIERGIVIPRLDTAAKIATGLNVKLDDLTSFVRQ